MESEIKIRDLGEAATLLTLGHEMLRLDTPRSAAYKIFIFKKSSDQPAIIQEYRSHKMKLDPHAFYMNVKELKARVHDATVE